MAKDGDGIVDHLREMELSFGMDRKSDRKKQNKHLSSDFVFSEV